MAKTLLVFDVDGTLLTNGPAAKTAFLRAFREVIGRAPEVETGRFAGGTDRGIVRVLVEEAGIQGDFEQLFARFEERFTQILAQEYPSHPDPRLLPGVPELLDELVGRIDVVLTLGTGNCRETCWIKLGRFDLQGFFSGGGFGGEEELRHRVVQRAIDAAQEVHGSFEAIWVIGDTPRDVQAARDVGANVLAVATGLVDQEELAASGPDALLEDFRDTNAVLRALKLDSLPA